MVLVAGASAGCGHRASDIDFARGNNRNVLLITVDTLRADALGIDSGRARTPAIDALARRGLHFSAAHSHAVVTLPSHASIVTGRYPFEHGYRDNSGYRLTAGTETLATRLRAAGFATGAFIGAFPLDARFGLTSGFDVYDGRFDDTGTGAAFVIPERPARAVVRAALQWIARQNGRWFAWIHVYDPHAPYRPEAPFDREYAAQPYYGEVAAVDAALAPLLDRVMHDPRPTLAILTGDHGEALGDHGEATHGLFAYESTLRVPLILSEIGGPREAQSSRPADDAGRAGAARHIDVVPTILDILGLPIPPELPGHSLRTAGDRAGAADRPSYFEAMSGALEYGWAPLDGILIKRRKYISLPIAELYDLAADAAERTNRAAADNEAVRTMAARLAHINSRPLTPPAAESSEVTARLRSLGYTASGAAPQKPPTAADDPKRLVELDRMMREAAELDEQQHLPEAVSVYQKILAKRPQMTAAARHLAFDQWRTRDAAAAIATLRRAIAANGPASGVHVQLGAYLVETGHPDQAVAVLEEAVNAGAGFDALHALGIAAARAGRPAKAEAAFERARSIDPESAMLFESIGAAYLEAGRFAESRRAFEQALALGGDTMPTDRARIHAALATAAARAGDFDAAVDHWKRAIAANPDNADALYDLGVQLARAGRDGEARGYLEQFLRVAPQDTYPRERTNVGAILRSLGSRR